MGCKIYFGPTQLTTSINLSAGGNTAISTDAAVEIDSSVPVNSDQAYIDWSENKKKAMESGGSGDGYAFDTGYVGVTADMVHTINGIQATDKGLFYIYPSLCITAVPNETSGIDLNGLCGCLTCDDYNRMFSYEMVLYHAINHVAWQIMRNGVTATHVNGSWELYQGLLARWNNFVYASSYIVKINANREVLSVQIGFMNNLCTVADAHVYATITPTSTPSGSRRECSIFYPQSAISKDTVQDGNVQTTDKPVYYIRRTDASGCTVITNGVLADLQTPDDYDLAACSAVGGNDPQATPKTAWTLHKLGLIMKNVPANAYHTQQFVLSGRLYNAGKAAAPNATVQDTYSVAVTWVITQSGETRTITQNLGTVKTYAFTDLQTI